MLGLLIQELISCMDMHNELDYNDLLNISSNNMQTLKPCQYQHGQGVVAKVNKKRGRPPKAKPEATVDDIPKKQSKVTDSMKKVRRTLDR